MGILLWRPGQSQKEVEKEKDISLILSCHRSKEKSAHKKRNLEAS